MRIIPEYTYLGKNGTVTTSVLLEAYHTTKYLLLADENCKLTKDGVNFVQNTIVYSEDDIQKWKEINGQF